MTNLLLLNARCVLTTLVLRNIVDAFQYKKLGGAGVEREYRTSEGLALLVFQFPYDLLCLQMRHLIHQWCNGMVCGRLLLNTIALAFITRVIALDFKRARVAVL